MFRRLMFQQIIGTLIGVIEGLVNPLAHDCHTVKDAGFNVSGLYHLTPGGTYKGFNVYCDMTTDGGGWLVFQRRQDGSVNFYRDWEDYQFGFGDPAGEHWLGNLVLHLLTQQGHYELRIDLTDWEGSTRFAKYRFFKLEPTKDKYILRVSGYSGNAGDALTYNNGWAFSTKDKDNDPATPRNCAEDYDGAWWYKGCHLAHLNGIHLEGTHNFRPGYGVIWKPWKGFQYSLKATEMKIRRI